MKSVLNPMSGELNFYKETDIPAPTAPTLYTLESTLQTPSVSTTYIQMTNNSMTLPEGRFLLGGTIEVEAVASASVAQLLCLWANANGNNTGTKPALASNRLTHVNVGWDYRNLTGAGGTNFTHSVANIWLNVPSGGQTVYLVPWVQEVSGNIANIRVRVYGWAIPI